MKTLQNVASGIAVVLYAITIGVLTMLSSLGSSVKYLADLGAAALGHRHKSVGVGLSYRLKDQPVAEFEITAAIADDEHREEVEQFLDHHLAAIVAGSRLIARRGAFVSEEMSHSDMTRVYEADGPDLLKLHTKHTGAAGNLVEDGVRRGNEELAATGT